MSPQQIKSLAIKATSLVAAVVLFFGSWYVVDPGECGVIVTMGKVSPHIESSGLHFKLPLVSKVIRVNTRQHTEELREPAFSSDLQTLKTVVKVLYRIPENSAAIVYEKYAGNPFDTVLGPKVKEALKESTVGESAEGIVKKREMIKVKTLEAARKKIGTFLVIEDVIIEDVGLSKELEDAIEQKMVQEQNASKAKFTKEKAQIDAETAAIVAEGEAQAINKRGKAIRENPGVVELIIAEKWDGVAPLVVGGDKGANIMLPIKSK